MGCCGSSTGTKSPEEDKQELTSQIATETANAKKVLSKQASANTVHVYKPSSKGSPDMGNKSSKKGGNNNNNNSGGDQTDSQNDADSMSDFNRNTRQESLNRNMSDTNETSIRKQQQYQQQQAMDHTSIQSHSSTQGTSQHKSGQNNKGGGGGAQSKANTAGLTIDIDSVNTEMDDQRNENQNIIQHDMNALTDVKGKQMLVPSRSVSLNNASRDEIFQPSLPRSGNAPDTPPESPRAGAGGAAGAAGVSSASAAGPAASAAMTKQQMQQLGGAGAGAGAGAGGAEPVDSVSPGPYASPSYELAKPQPLPETTARYHSSSPASAESGQVTVSAPHGAHAAHAAHAGPHTAPNITSIQIQSIDTNEANLSHASHNSNQTPRRRVTPTTGPPRKPLPSISPKSGAMLDHAHSMHSQHPTHSNHANQNLSTHGKNHSASAAAGPKGSKTPTPEMIRGTQSYNPHGAIVSHKPHNSSNSPLSSPKSMKKASSVQIAKQKRDRGMSNTAGLAAASTLEAKPKESVIIDYTVTDLQNMYNSPQAQHAKPTSHSANNSGYQQEPTIGQLLNRQNSQNHPQNVQNMQNMQNMGGGQPGDQLLSNLMTIVSTTANSAGGPRHSARGGQSAHAQASMNDRARLSAANINNAERQRSVSQGSGYAQGGHYQGHYLQTSANQYGGGMNQMQGQQQQMQGMNHMQGGGMNGMNGMQGAQMDARHQVNRINQMNDVQPQYGQHGQQQPQMYGAASYGYGGQQGGGGAPPPPPMDNNDFVPRNHTHLATAHSHGPPAQHMGGYGNNPHLGGYQPSGPNGPQNSLGYAQAYSQGYDPNRFARTPSPADHHHRREHRRKHKAHRKRKSKKKKKPYGHIPPPPSGPAPGGSNAGGGGGDAGGGAGARKSGKASKAAAAVDFNSNPNNLDDDEMGYDSDESVYVKQYTHARSLSFDNSFRLSRQAFNAKFNTHIKESVRNFNTQNVSDDEKNDGNGSARPISTAEEPHGLLTEKEFYHRYWIEVDKLGEGSFAKVRKIIRKEDKKQFALKMIKKAGKSKDDLAALEREIAILDKLNHPNVVGLYDWCETDTRIHMVVEFCDGGDVFERILKEKTFNEREAAHVIKQVAEGLKHIHKHGIVHRDLKPDNLMYLSKDPKSQIKIIDFGLAGDATGGPLSTPCGTAHYVAPEVLSNIPYNWSADMWSLGVIIYMLLCGFPPFFDANGNQKRLYKLIKQGKYRFPSPYWDYISENAKDLIRNLLVKDPNSRFTAKQVLKHRWIAGSAAYSDFSDIYMKQLEHFNSSRHFADVAVGRNSQPAAPKATNLFANMQYAPKTEDMHDEY